jgi:hypothetical protein
VFDIRRATRRARVIAILLALLPAPAFAQEYPNCPGHLFAIGSRLGWAEALARSAGPEQDATLFAHLNAVSRHAQAANAECAQAPPPWPVFQNWRQAQGVAAQIIDEYQRGLLNRSQLASRLGAWRQGFARELAFRVLGPTVHADRTCGELYVRIGGALAYAQTTTQIRQRLVPDAIDRLREARADAELSTTLRPACRDLSRLIADIDEALRHTADISTAPRVNDLWNVASLATGFGPPPPPSPSTRPALNPQDCGFHFWATGSRLGWAEAIARFGSPDADAVMFQHLVAAGRHVEAANAACAQEPPPWPAWQNWREVQAQLNQMADMYRRGLTSRAQLATALRGLRDALAGQLMWRTAGAQVVRDRTCGELYVRIGGALGFAQTTTQIHRRLIPEAADQLRQARQLIQLSLQMRPPCTSLADLLPLIDQALNQPDDARAVAAIDEAWRRGGIIMAPASPSWSAEPPPPPQPSRPAGGVVASGGLDPAEVTQKNNRLLNDFRYQQSSYEASPVTLEIVPPSAPGKPYTARITGQVDFRRHLKHPLRPGQQFEEWWQVTVTLGPGQGTLDRLEGPASSVENYRSVAPDRTDRKASGNERWYALRQPDGSYRLGMPGITDGMTFRLVVK